MSAVNASIAPTSLDAERRSHEPSMEEILASIRRIIADDEALPVVRREREKNEREAGVDLARDLADRSLRDETEVRGQAAESRSLSPAVLLPVRPSPVLDGPRPGVVQAIPASRLRELDAPRPAADEAEEAPEEIEEASNAEEDFPESGEFESFEETVETFVAVTAKDAPTEPPPLRAGKIEDAAESAGRPLVAPDVSAIIASHFQALAAGMVVSEAHVIERFAEDMLRPKLERWLDDNLPALVERLVREEIERMARKTR